MQNPDVARTCRHLQKWNTAHTDTHTHTLFLPLSSSPSLWLSLSLCMFSVSKLETVSSAKRDTKAIVLIQDSKPFRGFSGLTHMQAHTRTHTRTHSVMRFRACWTMSHSDTHTHTHKQVSPSLWAPMSKLIPPHWHNAGWPPSHHRIWLGAEGRLPHPLYKRRRHYLFVINIQTWSEPKPTIIWVRIEKIPLSFPLLLFSPLLLRAHCLTVGIFGGPASI